MTKIKSKHQMSKIEHNAFEEHCRASETHKTIRVDTTTTVNFNGDLANEFSGEDVVDTKWIKVKGYDNGKSFEDECYGCATQRYACEHDDINWEEYFAEEDMHEKDNY